MTQYAVRARDDQYNINATCTSCINVHTFDSEKRCYHEQKRDEWRHASISGDREVVDWYKLKLIRSTFMACMTLGIYASV